MPDRSPASGAACVPGTGEFRGEFMAHRAVRPRRAQPCLIAFPTAEPDPECCEPGVCTDIARLRVNPAQLPFDAGIHGHRRTTVKSRQDFRGL